MDRLSHLLRWFETSFSGNNFVIIFCELLYYLCNCSVWNIELFRNWSICWYLFACSELTKSSNDYFFLLRNAKLSIVSLWLVLFSSIFTFKGIYFRLFLFFFLGKKVNQEIKSCHALRWSFSVYNSWNLLPINIPIFILTYCKHKILVFIFSPYQLTKCQV